ncbi:hypothetical protein AB8A21_14030, partial [Streptomyces sp. BF23-18]
MARPCVELGSAGADAGVASAGSGWATRVAGRSGGSGAGAALAAGAAAGSAGVLLDSQHLHQLPGTGRRHPPGGP